MRSMSPEFIAALKSRRHPVVAKVEVLDKSLTVLAATDDPDTDLAVVDGETVHDRSQRWIGRYSLKLANADGSLVPPRNRLLSNTSGNLVRLYRGLLIAGVPEYKLLGTFGISDSDAVRSARGGLVIDVAGYDFSRDISRNRWRLPFVVSNGTPTVTLIENVIRDRRPGTEIVTMDLTGSTVPRQVFDDSDDPWEVVTTTADGDGLEVVWDMEGSAMIRPIPDPDADEVVWVFDTDEAELVEEIGRSSSNDEAYNGWIIHGENSYLNVAVLGEAYDTNPLSDTYAGDPTADPPIPPGDYGLVIGTETLSTVSTPTQAKAAALGKLNATKGSAEAVRVRGAVHPGLETGDVVQLKDSPLGLDGRYALDRVPVPLRAPQGQNLNTRERRIA